VTTSSASKQAVGSANRQTLTTGVIGCGHWGVNLVRNFSSLEGARLVGICDVDLAKLEALRGQYPGLPAVTDYHDLLGPQGPQALVVATPIDTHFTIARDCLLAGRHVFVEKPLCTRADEAEQLARLAVAQGTVLMVGHLLEYHPAVDFLKRHLASGALGRALEIHSRRINPLAGRHNSEGAMWDLAPHDLSVATYLLGVQPRQVRALRSTNGGEETVSLEVVYPGSALLHIEVSWRDPDKVRRMTIVGTRQRAVFDDLDERKVRIYDNGHHSAQPEPGETAFIPQIDAAEPLRQECLHFVDCVQGGGHPRSDAADGIHVVRVLEAAERSLSRGGIPITI